MHPTLIDLGPVPVFKTPVFKAPGFKTQFLAMMLAAAGCGSLFASDWPHYLGPNFDTISGETGLANTGPLELVWEAQVMTGFSSITAADGLVYTMGNNGKRDVVSCLNAESGALIWRRSYPSDLAPNMYEGGPSATPTIHEGKVYTLGKDGQVFCLNAKTGDTVWQADASDLGAEKPNWGFAGSATIMEDLAIFNIHKGVAFNKGTGAVVWKATGATAGYASPRPFPLGKGRQGVAIFHGAGLSAFDPKSGKELWSYPWTTKHGVNAANPVYFDGKMFLSSGYGTGCALIDIARGTPKELWRNKNMHNHFQSSLFLNGYLYGIDGQTGKRSRLTCLDPSTGEAMWTEELGFGTLTVADGKLYVLDQKGQLFIVAPPLRVTRSSTDNRFWNPSAGRPR